jgi:hypothetical protein
MVLNYLMPLSDLFIAAFGCFLALLLLLLLLLLQVWRLVSWAAPARAV